MAEWKMDGKPGLVILHMQETIAGSVGKQLRYAHTMHPVIRESGMIGHIQELLKAFRNKNLPVVFVNAIMGMGGLQHKLPAYGKLFEMIRGDLSTLDNIEQALKTIPEMDRRPDEPVLLNWLLGAFSYSGLDTMLRVKGVNTIVFAGFASHSAIFNAVIQASDLWYSAVVPRDATTTHLTELGEIMFKDLYPSYSLVTTTKDIIAHL